MSAVFLIFVVCIIGVEMLAIYSPLYYVCYVVYKFDRKVGDGRLTVILLTLSLILSIILFPYAAGLYYKIAY